VEKVGKGVRVPPRDALIAESCTPENRGRGFGLHRSMDNVGSIVGPLLASSLLVYLNNDYRTLFWISSIPAFLAIGILTFMVSEKPREISKTEVPSENRRIDLKQFNRNFKMFLIATVIFEMANSSNAFLLLRVQDIGLSLELIPIIYLFSNIFRTISSMPGGILSDKLGRRNVLIAGWIVYGISYFGFAFITSVTQAWVIFGIYGLFSGMTEGVKKAYVADLVPKEARGSAYGIHSFLVSFPQLPASLLLGFLWQKVNATVAFSVGASFAVVAGLFLLILIPGRPPKDEILQKI
jgi:MFS family permease